MTTTTSLPRAGFPGCATPCVVVQGRRGVWETSAACLHPIPLTPSPRPCLAFPVNTGFLPWDHLVMSSEGRAPGMIWTGPDRTNTECNDGYITRYRTLMSFCYSLQTSKVKTHTDLIASASNSLFCFSFVLIFKLVPVPFPYSHKHFTANCPFNIIYCRC